MSEQKRRMLNLTPSMGDGVGTVVRSLNGRGVDGTQGGGMSRQKEKAVHKSLESKGSQGTYMSRHDQFRHGKGHVRLVHDCV